MPILSNTNLTYSNTGNKEDIANAVYMVSPTETPFINTIAKKGKASNTLHQWQTRSLAAAAANAQIEGDEFTNTAATATTMNSNNLQISSKVMSVSKTQQAINSYGNANDLAEQVAVKGLELRRDMERVITQNQAAVTGNSTTARQLRSLEAWFSTNVSRGSGGANGSTSTAATDGTLRPFSEPLFKTVLQSCFDNGGNPAYLMVGSAQKQVVSGFAGGATAYRDAANGTIIAGYDIYKSDFGTLTVIPNRFQRNRTAMAIDPEYVSVDFLRNMEIDDLAKTGDADRKAIISEYTLAMLNEAAHGVIADLS